MLALVINLDDQPARLAHVRDEVGRLAVPGLEVRRIAAVDGRAMDAAALDAFIGASPRARGWLPGQIGCLLSHREAWRAIVESGDGHGVVFEDDVHVARAAAPFLRDASWVPSDADVVRLEASGKAQRLGAPVATPHGRALRPVLSEAWNGTAYLIRADTAAMLLAAPRRWWQPLDFLLYDRATSPVARALRVLQLDPAVCEQDKVRDGGVGFESAIEDGLGVPPQGRLRTLVRPLAQRLRGRTLTRFVA